MNTAQHHKGLKFSSGSSGMAVAMLLCTLMLAGCGSTSLNRAPVEDRRVGAKPLPTPSSSGASSSAPSSVSSVSSASNTSMASGQPGTYTVKPGDTLIKIGLDSGQSWRDIRRWNNIDNPNQIEVGQVLRVAPPGTVTSNAAQTAPVQTAAVQAQPKSAASQQASAPQSAASPSTSAAADTTSADDAVSWAWPVQQGAVLSGFDEIKNKGVDLAGNLGDPVLAAADGRVVYSGAGLRGYGNLIILKHNNTYLTAYAHNQTLLVKEDQTVRKGQKIAEMGNSDADRIKLHFELRRQGKPVDPLKFLPAR